MAASFPRLRGLPLALALSLGSLSAQQASVPDNPGSNVLNPRQPEVRSLPKSIQLRLADSAARSLGAAPDFAARSDNHVGIHRGVPPDVTSSGAWQTLPNGDRIWRLTLRSDGARSLRVHFSDFQPGAGQVHLFVPGDPIGDTAVGPYTGRGPLNNGEFWSEVTFADRVTIEYQPADNSGTSLPFRIDKLSHAVRDVLPGRAGGLKAIADPNEPRGPATRQPDLLRSADSSDREAAAACHVDVSCHADYATSARAVAHIQFEDDGAFVCTGWLINTRSSSNTPFFMTNNHCMPNQAVADTLAAFWNYRTPVCNGAAPNLPPRQSLGATLLVTRPADELDFAFLRLPGVPANAFFMGWTTTRGTLNAPVTSIGHPQGDFQRIAFATVTGGAAGDKFTVRPTQNGGLTEGGSSGSPWLSSPGVAVGLHARGNAVRFVNVCSALRNGQIEGGGEWFAAIYPFVSSFLEDTGPCTFSLNSTNQTFASSGGTGTVSVSSRSGCNWTATSNSSFITVTGGATGSANGSVSYTVTANTSTNPRSGTITIGAQTFTVNQAAFSPACQTTPISLGSTANGNLANACASALRPGKFASRYTFSGTSGQQVVVEASSTAFDTYMFLVDPSGNTAAQDDDGGVGTNSRIPRDSGLFRLASNGTYTIEVTSFANGSTGAFRLTLASSTSCTNQTISFGQTINGFLTTTDCLAEIGEFYTDYYSFQGTAGQQINISMNSTAVDPYLILNGPNGDVIAEVDDISGSDLNSRIPVSGNLTLPVAGTYTIQASTFNELETGSYTLTLLAPGSPTPSGNGPFRFVPVTPCRIMDTRVGEGKTGAFGPPFLSGNTTRDVPVPSGSCDIPSTARAYSFNVTVVPRGPLSFLTIYPSGQSRPLASTLNSFSGSVVANAAIVPAGTNAGISVYVTDATDVIIDINGYFAP